MYRYQHSLVSDEALYIAGPECFYTYGYDALGAMKARAEALGFSVTLPNSDPLDMENPDLQKRADSIFANLEKVMLDTTAIVADLEAYRGAEPDSGTVYELGMAYAKGAKCYGYTRDKRSFATKNPNTRLQDGNVTDEFGNHPFYGQLPFAPTIIGSTKIVEGRFEDCLQMMILDKEEESKFQARRGYYVDRSKVRTEKPGEKPFVYLAGVGRYQENAQEIFGKMKEICAAYGLQAFSPVDWAAGVEQLKTENPYVWAQNLFDNFQQHVRNCDVIVADLNNYRGYEVNNDVGFECGMGFQLGKKLYGYMDDTSPMIRKIPHLGADKEYRDHTGSNVENFNYPCNLMFGCSMKIFEGKFEKIIANVAEDLLSK